METKYICPVCGESIDPDSIDMNNNEEDGYGQMEVPCSCKNCGAPLTAVFDCQNGYNFICFDVN